MVDIDATADLAKLLVDPALGDWAQQIHSLSGDGELQDVTVAWRGLRKSPGFAATVILTLALTQNVNRIQLEWAPTIMHDLHESLPLLYTYSGAAPQNPNLDPILFTELPLLERPAAARAARRSGSTPPGCCASSPAPKLRPGSHRSPLSATRRATSPSPCRGPVGIGAHPERSRGSPVRCTQLTFFDLGISKIAANEHQTSTPRPGNDCGHPR